MTSNMDDREAAEKYFAKLKIDTSTNLVFLPESVYFDDKGKPVTFNSIFIAGCSYGRAHPDREMLYKFADHLVRGSDWAETYDNLNKLIDQFLSILSAPVVEGE